MTASPDIPAVVGEALARRRAVLRKGADGPVVGFLSAFAPPPEFLEACGCIPVRLLEGGTGDHETRALPYLKNESCSLDS